MRCPGCKGLMRAEKHQHVEFDICPECRGWVSGEQFHALAVNVAAYGQVESSVKLTFQPRKVMRCPKIRHSKGISAFIYARGSICGLKGLCILAQPSGLGLGAPQPFSP